MTDYFVVDGRAAYVEDPLFTLPIMLVEQDRKKAIRFAKEVGGIVMNEHEEVIWPTNPLK